MYMLNTTKSRFKFAVDQRVPAIPVVPFWPFHSGKYTDPAAHFWECACAVCKFL